MAVDEEIYYDQLKYRRENVAKNTKSLTKQKYNRLVEEVKYIKALNDPESGVNGKKTNRMFWVQKTYDIVELNDVDRLICPKYNGKNYLLYVYDDEIFNIIRDLHESEDRHMGRDRMMKEINKKYKNITRSEVILYIKLCGICQQKIKPSRTFDNDLCKLEKPEIKTRCLINVVPFHKTSMDIYNYFMVYEDLLTNFVILRALKTNEIDEICNEISDIFSIFGASTILQSQNGEEFVERIIKKLMTQWDGLKLISGYLLNGNINNVHKDISAMIELWQKDHPTNGWHESLKYVQFVKNSSINSNDKLSPYQKVFGHQSKFGLRSSNLDEKFIDSIKTEKELDDLLDETDGDDDDKQNVDENFMFEEIVVKNELF